MNYIYLDESEWLQVIYCTNGVSDIRLMHIVIYHCHKFQMLKTVKLFNSKKHSTLQKDFFRCKEFWLIYNYKVDSTLS